MKKILNIILVALIGYVILPSSLVSCTDMSGDGIDSVYHSGSTVPQSTQYRNPVWEPSLEAGTVYKGGSLYVKRNSMGYRHYLLCAYPYLF